MSYNYYDDLSGCSDNHDDDNDDSGTDNDTDTDNIDSNYSKKQSHRILAPNNNVVTNSQPESNHVNNDNSNNIDIKIPYDLWDHSIIHLDIDCFYCQCEEIDRNLRQQHDNGNNTNNIKNNFDNNNTPPLAVGQKHIIVTCNYAARKLGVQKLQLRQDALKICPNLWIVEGSDLEKYRRHSRTIYETFRLVIQGILRDINNNNIKATGKNNNKNNNDNNQEIMITIPACKGSGMDEMMADLSQVVDHLLSLPQKMQQLTGNNIPWLQHDIQQAECYIFGEPNNQQTIVTEDQTSHQVVVNYTETSLHNNKAAMSLPLSRQVIHDHVGSTTTAKISKDYCIKRLQMASKIALHIQQQVYQITGFTTTIGVSTSLQLAKLAGGLEKPKSVNILYPWRSSHLLYPMPLRKLHNVGRRTIKALHDKMELYCGKRNNPSLCDFWTVMDLLKLPEEAIVSSLNSLQSQHGSSIDNCKLLIDKCRGIDNTKIMDDNAVPPKTISVENSFRRGTIQSLDLVWKALNELFERLPRLVDDRTTWSKHPQRAYPTTIRLTIRINNNDKLKQQQHQQQQQQQQQQQRRRPFVTTSKQAPFIGGPLFIQSSTTKETRIQMLKRCVTPLVHALLTGSSSLQNQNNNTTIDVTRMNLAVTNFQDCSDTKPLPNKISKKMNFFSGTMSQPSNNNDNDKGSILKTKSAIQTSFARTNSSTSKANKDSSGKIGQCQSPKKYIFQSSKISTMKQPMSTLQKRTSTESKSSILYTIKPSEIDPTVLASLPPEIVAELKQSIQQPKKRRIDQYFTKAKR